MHTCHGLDFVHHPFPLPFCCSSQRCPYRALAFLELAFSLTMWSIPPLLQSHCCFPFCVVTSLFSFPGLLTTHVRLSPLCVHGLQMDTPLETHLGPRWRQFSEGILQRSLCLMTNREDTHLTTQTRVRTTDMPTNCRTKRYSSPVLQVQTLRTFTSFGHGDPYALR